jgi:cysteine desulfurase/selenocysteine lyase
MSDPIEQYVGNSKEFPVLSNWDFFNHAGASPLPRAVADAMRKIIDTSEKASYVEDHRYTDLDQIRAAAAAMINADPAGEIALLKNTAEGISLVARGAVDWKPGDRIVIAAGEYPANVYPWMDVAQRHGVELVTVPEVTDADGTRQVPIESILRYIARPQVKLVALSHVEYATGQRHDLATIGNSCRERGSLFCVDAIQSLGALPLDVKTMQIDYLACGGQKWLLGPEGAAFFYCRRDLVEKTRPLDVGASSVINHLAYGDYDYTLKSDALRFESGSQNIVGHYGLLAAMRLLHGLGADGISRRIKHLTDRLIEGVRDKGYAVISPRTGEQWSGIVCFTSPTHDHNAVARTLRKDHRTEIVVREGRLRVSPHFYNTDEQIDRLVDRLPSH